MIPFVAGIIAYMLGRRALVGRWWGVVLLGMLLVPVASHGQVVSYAGITPKDGPYRDPAQAQNPMNYVGSVSDGKFTGKFTNEVKNHDTGEFDPIEWVVTLGPPSGGYLPMKITSSVGTVDGFAWFPMNARDDGWVQFNFDTQGDYYDDYWSWGAAVLFQTIPEEWYLGTSPGTTDPTTQPDGSVEISESPSGKEWFKDGADDISAQIGGDLENLGPWGAFILAGREAQYEPTTLASLGPRINDFFNLVGGDGSLFEAPSGFGDNTTYWDTLVAIDTQVYFLLSGGEPALTTCRNIVRGVLTFCFIIGYVWLVWRTVLWGIQMDKPGFATPGQAWDNL